MIKEFSGIGHATKERVSGVTTIPGGVFEKLKIDGVCTITSKMEGKDLSVDGVFTCEDDVIADSFNCGGVVTIKGNLRAKELDIDGVATIRGNKLEADTIVCDGVLTSHGEVSADTIEADGFISAKEIVGDRIIIHSRKKNFFYNLFASKFLKYSEVDLIEASFVELRHVRAKKVSGHDVIIGKGCIVACVDCSGTLRIDADAQVKETTGDYTKQA
jgi:hypothetical protein